MSASQTIREETAPLREELLALLPDELITESVELYIAYLHWLVPAWIFFEIQLESSPVAIGENLSEDAGLRTHLLSADYTFLTLANPAPNTERIPSLRTVFGSFTEIPDAEQAIGILAALLSLERDSGKFGKLLKRNGIAQKEAISFYSGSTRRRRRERNQFFRLIDESFSEKQTRNAAESAKKTLRAMISHFESFQSHASILQRETCRQETKQP